MNLQKYKPYCARCYYHLHPELKVSRRYKTKERYLYQALQESFSEEKFTWDKRVDGGCSGARPDFRFECLTHTVIVECDEGQHVSYECENKRTMGLFVDCGSRPVVLIRFNPDSYRDEDGVRHAGAFHKSTQEVQLYEWTRRYEILERTLADALATVPEKEVNEVKLFYSHKSKKQARAMERDDE